MQVQDEPLVRNIRGVLSATLIGTRLIIGPYLRRTAGMDFLNLWLFGGAEGGSNPWLAHCERELVGSTDYDAFSLVTKHSTKQPSERIRIP